MLTHHLDPGGEGESAELRLDQCGHPRVGAHDEGGGEEQGQLPADPAGGGGGVPGAGAGQELLWLGGGVQPVELADHWRWVSECVSGGVVV